MNHDLPAILVVDQQEGVGRAMAAAFEGHARCLWDDGLRTRIARTKAAPRKRPSAVSLVLVHQNLWESRWSKLRSSIDARVEIWYSTGIDRPDLVIGPCLLGIISRPMTEGATLSQDEALELLEWVAAGAVYEDRPAILRPPLQPGPPASPVRPVPGLPGDWRPGR